MQKSKFRTTSFRLGRAARTALPIFLGICLTLSALAMPATAASVQLAQTVPTDPNDGSWTFTNNSGISGTFATVSGGSPVTFNYSPGSINGSLDSQLTGNLAAHLFLSATTATPAGTAFSGLFFDQPIDSGTLQILLDAPINGKSDLLTVSFTNANIAGFNGTPSFSDTDGLAGGTVSYTSDFLSFTGTTTGNNFLTPMFADLSLGAGNFLNNFVANGISTFGFDNSNLTVGAVPEPSSSMLLSLGALALVGATLKRLHARQV